MSEKEQIAELESRIAFQEEAIDKLSDIVARQERDLEQLTRMVQFLNTEIKSAGIEDTDLPPPHY